MWRRPIWQSRLHQMTVAFSYIQEVCPYFCNQFNSTLTKVIDKLYLFNSTPTKTPELIQVLDWVSKTLMKIFHGDFKQFNSTLTKTRIQIESGSECLEKLPVQSREPEIKWSLKYSKIWSSQLQSVKNFRGGSVGCLKIIKNRSSDANLTSTRRSRFN